VNRKTEPTTRIRSNPRRWHRLKDILADALERTSSEERAAFLRQSCAGDTELLHDAEKLLACDTAIFEEFAEYAGARLRQDQHSRVGERIGAYAIVRELARGGMGAVYLAERADGQFAKRVAVKVLKRGTDTDEVLRRFRTERQILANLDHPSITRLLDAGTTTDGLPYFVMEFIQGTPITRFVQQQKMGVRGRLYLFLKICSAVDLAHRNQIIHRDIKPTNVLVKADGEPKLLDFGIAKLLSDDSADATTTVATKRRLTPAYAAPEQVTGEPATIATDIYSLGALLYELLADKPPYGSSNGPLSQDAASRQLAELPLPSEIVTDPQTKRRLQGELDGIVARAMQHDPAQRYTSVIDLSEDVERYLGGTAPRAEYYSAAASAGNADRGAPSRDANHSGATANSHWRIAVVALGAVVLLAAFLSAGPTVHLLKKYRIGSAAPATPGTAAKQVRSIAVLPFENLSDDKTDAYLAFGIQDDVLAHLANIEDLKVISRRSVMSYRGRAVNVREMGKALGVSSVLEGTVHRVGNRVRVNVHLIDAENDDDIWAANYDEKLTDVFVIQTDLAKKIASELQIRLSPAAP
jgi:eukaryotic-like serine/threonine-protein kinase